MTLQQAVDSANGRKIRRPEWTDNVVLEFMYGDAWYILYDGDDIGVEDGLSVADALADDWEVVEPEETNEQTIRSHST